MVAYFLLVFAVAFLLTLVLTPLVIRLAYRVGAIDIPNKRKFTTALCPAWAVWLFTLVFGGCACCRQLHL